MPLRGSGTAGTAPEWFRLFRSSGMVQTDTGSAVGAPTAATAGTTTTATLASPFAATADLYRGMPVNLSGNPATARFTMITDYTVGRLATFARTFGSTLNTSTLAQIPINNLLELSDVDTDWPRLTVYAYQAGQLYIGTGCIALAPRISLSAGGPGAVEFDLIGVLAAASPAETALPSGAALVSRPTPPIWRDGECQLGRATVRAASASFALGSSGMLPPNPENANGFDIAELMARNPTCDVALMANSTAAPGRVTALRNGTDTLFSAMLGTTAGNRIGLLFHPARIVSIRNGQQDGADVEQISMAAALPGVSVSIAAF
jgi:hypothetical protein